MEPVAREQHAGVESLAIGLIHSYANRAHERRVAQILSRDLPDVSISLSSDVSPEIREYDRLSTTTANAYVQPLMAGFLSRLEVSLAQQGFRCPVLLMMSSGGMTRNRGPGHEVAVSLPIRAFAPADAERRAGPYRSAPGIVPPSNRPAASRTRAVFDHDVGAFADVPVYARSELSPGAFLPGPALIVEDETSSLVNKNHDVLVNALGYLVLTRKELP